MTGWAYLMKGMEMQLPDIEAVSAKVHEAWMDSKRAQGVASRKAEDGEELMATYTDLSEKAKDLDRGTVRAVFAAISALGAPQDGASLIAAERRRQIETEGWTPEHDDEHEDGELAMAAALYAAPEKLFLVEKNAHSVKWKDPWPWHDYEEPARGGPPIKVPAWDKRKQHSRLRRLVIAGALIAAEIERLQRLTPNAALTRGAKEGEEADHGSTSR